MNFVVLVFVKQFWPLTKKQYCSWLSWLGFGLSVVCALGVGRFESSLGRSQKQCILLVTEFSTISVQCSLRKRDMFCFWRTSIRPNLPSVDTKWCTTIILQNTELLISCENHPSYFILHTILKMKLFWIDVSYATFILMYS